MKPPLEPIYQRFFPNLIWEALPKIATERLHAEYKATDLTAKSRGAIQLLAQTDGYTQIIQIVDVRLEGADQTGGSAPEHRGNTVIVLFDHGNGARVLQGKLATAV